MSSKLSEADIVDFLEAGSQAAGTGPGDPLTKARVRVTLDQLRPYDRNPRQSRNPKFDSILASIEARGLDHPPNISRRHPDDPHYLIIDGGNTRLEILNILYDKYKGLAETAASDEERLAHHEKAQSFYIIDCIFKPWESESSTLAGHMSENEERGDTLFIEKALAVQEFRRVYEEEDRAAAETRGETWHGKPLTIRALAERITAQGWTVDNTHISRYEYATEQLLPIVPTALWAGGGHLLIKNIRRLEKAYTAFWAAIDAGRDNPQRIQDLFFDTLRAFDDESIDIEGFTQALDAALAEEIDLPAMTIRAEVGAQMAGGMRPGKPPAGPATADSGAAAPRPPTPFPESGNRPRRQRTTPQAPPAAPAMKTREQVREAILREATALAEAYRLVVTPFDADDVARDTAWFILHPLDQTGDPGEPPEPHPDDARAAMWWALFRLSGCWRRIADMQGVFERTFAAHLQRQSVIDTVLRLDDASIQLPESVRAQLDAISELTRQGAGLKEVTQGDDDDVQGTTQ